MPKLKYNLYCYHPNGETYLVDVYTNKRDALRGLRFYMKHDHSYNKYGIES